MPPATPDIDVVVVTWNGREMLDSCLAHLARQTVPHRVIVADNGSTDGTVEHVRAHHPGIDLVALPENVGFGRGNNAGVAHGSAPYVVLLNNDVDVEPEFLERVVAPLRADAGCGAVAALTLQPTGDVVDQVGITLDAGLQSHTRGRGERPDGLVPGPLAAPCAGAAAYRREAFEQVGGFAPELFLYSEDLDLGLRIHAAGWTFASVLETRAVHLGGGTTSHHSELTRLHSAFGRGFVLGRFSPPSRFALLRSLAVEVAVVLWGLLRHRTTAPLTGRLRGWRAARGAGAHYAVPPELIDESVSFGVVLRRLVSGE
ncbi:MAG: glycosyltransferase family 2 protein [Solirubrobacteraceae bacterium]|nr:glycosyltransferase family 2 protein [Solirubrobacteraceae bacterium]